MTYLRLLFLCVKHVRVDTQRAQDAHHQLLLSQPRAELTCRCCETAQPISTRL